MDFSTYLRKYKLDENGIKYFIGQIAEGYKYLSSKNLMHRGKIFFIIFDNIFRFETFQYFID